MRPPLTLCVITLNEEANLADCLGSVAAVPGLVTETVVLDSGSTDRTREIAQSFGARFVVHPFDGHVEQKNRALDLAKTEWVLSLDADERLSPELGAEMLRALEAPSLPDAFSMPRCTRYLGRYVRHGDWYPDRKVRLFRRDRARWGGTNPHDRVEVDGRVGKLSGDLLHHSYRSLSDHIRQMDSFTTIAARAMRERGRRAPLFRLLLNPPAAFFRSWLFRLGFLDGFPGFAVATTGAFYVFLKYAKLRELGRSDPRG